MIYYVYWVYFKSVVFIGLGYRLYNDMNVEKDLDYLGVGFYCRL